MRREDGDLLLAFGDPFDARPAGLGRGAHRRGPSTGAWRTAPTSRRYLARARTGHARDGQRAPAQGGAGRRRGQRVEDLSLQDDQRGRQPGGEAGELDAVRRAQGRRERHPSGIDRLAAWSSSTASTACSPRSARSPGAETAEQVISRIKVMAELDIAERRMPQDGRFKVRDQRARNRFPRFHHAEHLRRGRGAAHSRQAARSRTSSRACGWTRWASTTRRHGHLAAQARERAVRHAAGHRADRQRQDHHAVRRALGDQQRPRQDHHHRRPGGVPAARACCRSR